MPSDTRQFALRNGYDVVQARQYARELARLLGFGLTDQTRFATAVSEVAHRAAGSRGQGALRLATVASGLRRGLECICQGGRDLKPPADGDTLAGVERLVDEFRWEEAKGDEIAVVMRKWLH